MRPIPVVSLAARDEPEGGSAPAGAPTPPARDPDHGAATEASDPASRHAGAGSSRPRPFRRPGRPPLKGGVREDSSREKLLDVAIDLFADRGYEPVSTAAVARAAGLSQSMVHYHFGSKEQLWREAIYRIMRRRGRYFPLGRMETPGLNPLERLRTLIRRLVAANAAEPRYIRIVSHEAMGQTQRFDWLMETFIRPGVAAFDDAIADAMAQGLVRPLPPHQTSNIITSAASMTFTVGAVTRTIHGNDPCDPEQVRIYSDAILSVLFDGLLAASRDDASPA